MKRMNPYELRRMVGCLKQLAPAYSGAHAYDFAGNMAYTFEHDLSGSYWDRLRQTYPPLFTEGLSPINDQGETLVLAVEIKPHCLSVVLNAAALCQLSQSDDQGLRQATTDLTEVLRGLEAGELQVAS